MGRGIKMKEFKLWVEVRGGYYTNVEADSLEEAIDIAMDEADFLEVDEWDYAVEEA
jgi:hypothetical protein